jgi:Ca-activated chloride channel family protein
LILPFDSRVRTVISGDGTPASQARLLAAVQQQKADDGTDMYACAERAMEEMQPFLKSGAYLPAIVIMTDGRSDKRDNFQSFWKDEGHALPIFGVTFGDADKSQLDDVSKLTSARVFDGKANLAQAFRSVRGYN